jgi:uncharacterized phiE125 gp8 family phage protein
MKLVTPPASLAVSLEQARLSARIDGTEADAELEQVIRQHTGDAEHITGRAFITQTWRLTLDAFTPAIKLPMPPLASVESVKFYDVDGVLQTLSPLDYIVDSASEPGYVVPAPGKQWPATQSRINAVEIQYVCGYGQSESDIPSEIKGYILGRVAEHFAPNNSGRSDHLPRLLDRYRVYTC